ncbi:Cysteine dioxygenase 1 [Toxocara canis]|uniref:Cysteine dioxygenase n=1 Tax=Toxocara canis TaxID=6265 RepID=A0A0B2UZS8_TOXCA|nr:Cysteine dioxygenase 1 [Toxocara canis]
MEKLCGQLREIFDDDHIDVEAVKDVLRAYSSNPTDWIKFAKFDDHKYTRNLVDAGNGKYNLMALCWGPGMGSSIHDHANSHCFVKILHGELLETRYKWPSDETIQEPLVKTSATVCSTNEVSYICDEIGLHRMENPSHSNNAVSLHLYIPPYQHCNSFDQKTGRKIKCPVTFYSKYGKNVDYRGFDDGCTIVAEIKE